MILFFDRNIGKRLPQALLHLRPPCGVEFHLGQKQAFAADAPDDEWLSVVGARGWVVVTHDAKFHRVPIELAAIRQHRIGVFYLAGAELPTWERARIFFRAFDRIAQMVATTTPPFIFRVDSHGRLRHVALDA